MIGFEQKHVGAPQMELDGFGHVAQVGGDADAHALGFEAEAHRVDGVVRDAEALHFDIADPEAGAGLEGLQARRRNGAPVDGGGGQARQVDHGADALLAGQHRKTGDVIGVFVGDQDGVDGLERFTDRGEAFAQFAHAEAGVDQNARIFGGQEGGVAGTAAGQHAEFYDCPSPEHTEYTESR